MRLAVLLALALPASAKDQPGRASGVVAQSLVKVAPSDGGPVLREGKLTITLKDGTALELKVTPKSKVTLDGKPAKYQKAAAPGAVVLRALYEPATKVLTSIDLKSGPRPKREDDAAGPVTGEIAATDIVANTVSVRTASATVTFSVPESAALKREGAGGVYETVGLDALRVGDTVSVESADGKTATSVSARGPK